MSEQNTHPTTTTKSVIIDGEKNENWACVAYCQKTSVKAIFESLITRPTPPCTLCLPLHPTMLSSDASVRSMLVYISLCLCSFPRCCLWYPRVLSFVFFDFFLNVVIRVGWSGPGGMMPVRGEIVLRLPFFVLIEVIPLRIYIGRMPFSPAPSTSYVTSMK